MRVFLDDVRPAPEGWARAHTPEEVIGLLRSGRVEALSLDFDLGFRGEEERRTGEVVLRWIEERVFRGEADTKCLFAGISTGRERQDSNPRPPA